MSDLSEFRVYPDEPSVIYEISTADCLVDINADDLGEMCVLWLQQEYPQCTFVYETDSFAVFLDGGHGLTEAQIRLVQQKARAFARGVVSGSEMERRHRQNAISSEPKLAEIARLKAQAEKAYDEMYELHDDREIRRRSEFACEWLLSAARLARELGLVQDAANHEQRARHIREVYRRQFRQPGGGIV